MYNTPNYQPSKGIEQIVQYSRPAFDGYASRPEFNQVYDNPNINHSTSAKPAYLESIDAAVNHSYTIDLDRHETITVGTNNNYQQNKQENPVSENYNNTRPTAQIPTISATPFVNPWIETKFIGEVEDIKEHVEETFQTLTGKELPDDFTIEVCDEERLKQLHEQFGGTWSPGIQGFAINKRHLGRQSHIFIKKAQLAHVMVVIGHELGHIQSNTLLNSHDEEAKAYAFEMAWIKAIHDHNIAGLQQAINLNGQLPAQNGLHNVAFDFIRKLQQAGKQAIDIFKELIKGELNVKHDTSF